ncbi:MAG: ABC transporter permease [Verrucomicrobia bacterium]|nr:ABC transporter permease [Verrucomicrobiota bacterium]
MIFDRWIWLMAWRDSRASRRKLFLFSCSIVLGIAALVSITSLGRNLELAVADQAKTLLGADLVVSARQPFSARAEELIKELGGEQAREVAFSSMALFPKTEGTRLVQIRSLTDGFPFYGKFETVPVEAGESFRSLPGALVEESLMNQFNAKVGDPIKLGQLILPIAGILQKIPGEALVFSTIAPRVYIPATELPKTKLVKAESLARFKVFIKYPSTINVEALAKKHRNTSKDLRLELETVEDRKRDLGRSLNNLQTFLSLGGFIALLLGGVGVASAIHVHVKEKVPGVAVLRCLGASASRTVQIYVAQGMGLGLTGAIVGGALGVILQFFLPRVVQDFVALQIDYRIAWPSVFGAMGAGFLICVLFTLLPILPLRRVSPLAVLRASEAEPLQGDPARWLIFGLMGLGITGFSLWQSTKWYHGLAFTGGILAAFGLLAGVAKILTQVARKVISRSWPYVWRQGLANLHRPNNRTTLLMLSLGLGTFLVLTMFLVQQTLLVDLLPSGHGRQPNTVLFDVQSDQIEGVERLLKDRDLEILQRSPVVTMRLASVKGRAIGDLLKAPDRQRAPNWVLRREFRSTWRDQLVDTEESVAGHWPAERAQDVTPISLESGIAKDLGVTIGDDLVFDVQGVPITTRVAHLRNVDWRRMSPNFFVVFPSNSLEAAPAFHILTTRTPTAAAGAEMHHELIGTFPNISLIDLTLVLKTVDVIISKISLAVRFMAMFILGTGFLVLVAAILTGRYQRMQESILLRTLGASRRKVLQILLIEYFLLGFFASLTGVLLALGGAWALVHFTFKLPFHPPMLATMVTVTSVCVITMGTGLAMSWGVLNRPPLEILRGE